MAARSYLTWQNSKLSRINYPYNSDWTIPEATARRIIFESLPWEYKRIEKVSSTQGGIKRSYYDSTGRSRSVRLDISVSSGEIKAKLTYCMPVLFGLTRLFGDSSWESVCGRVSGPAGTRTYSGIPVEEEVTLLDNL
jgi:hypothetical protein